MTRRRKGGAALGLAALGAAGMVLGLAGPAGATVVPSANSNVIGVTGNTPYNALRALADLYNGSEGCNLLVPTGQTQPFDYSCPSGGSLPVGDPPGYGPPTVGGQYSENPFNDVVSIEPPVSSSASITQIENQGAHTTSTAAGNFAGSANAAKTGAGGKFDDQGLNYVAYAAGAVDYVVYTKVGNAKTAAGTLKKGLTQAQLQAIWSGADKCWSDVGATGKLANDLIDPYSIFTSSAITSTWDAFLSPDNSETYVEAQTNWPPSPLPTCHNGKKAVYAGKQSFTNYSGSHTIQQNELSTVNANDDQADAITFFSYGRYEEQLKSPALAGSVLGAVNSVAPTKQTILGGTYPVLQFLYNVYPDGTNPNIPVATPATLNFASENGFLCKPNTDAGGAQIVDPLTGVTYRSEIESAIAGAGFLPLDGLDENVPFGEEGAAVTAPASSIPSFTSSPYYPYDKLPTSGGQPQGYCLVTTSDGNTGHQ
jgi:ABC-type phosphate transport system substrate-binding protein